MGFPESHQPRLYTAPNFLKMGIYYLNLSSWTTSTIKDEKSAAKFHYIKTLSGNVVVVHPQNQTTPTRGVYTTLYQCPKFLTTSIASIWARHYHIIIGGDHNTIEVEPVCLFEHGQPSMPNLHASN